MGEIDLIARLRRLLPVSWDNEVDGRGEPTHAVLSFGPSDALHSTQAITMCPDDWMALNELPDTIQSLLSQVEGLRASLESIVDATKEAACDLAVVTLTIRFDEVHELARQAIEQSQ